MADGTGLTALMAAATNLSKKSVEALINEGANVNAQDWQGCTALMAMFSCNIDDKDEARALACVELLLKAGADVNIISHDGESVLALEALHYRPQSDLVKLLQSQAERNNTMAVSNDKSLTNVDGSTTEECKRSYDLFESAKYGECKQLVDLIKAGADVNSVNPVDGRSALMTAVYKGNNNCVKLLIELGTDVNQMNEHSRPALILAAEKGNLNCMKELIAAGADVNIRMEKWLVKDTPLAVAAYHGNQDCVKLLIQAGADVNICDKCGESPLSYSAHRGHDKCVEILIKAGADVNNSIGNSLPLMRAVSRGHMTCLRILLSAGADVNKTDSNGKTPLYRAVYKGHGNIVSSLIKAGADVNCKKLL